MVKKGKHYYTGKKTLIHCFCIFLAILSVLPLWIMLTNATRSTVQIQQGISLIPSTHLLENWEDLSGKGFNPFVGFCNSALISFSCTALTIYFSTMTAYGLSVYNFKGKKIIFGLILGIIMIPGQLSLVGFYQFMLKLNLTNSYIPLILPSIAAPSTVFFMKQYFSSNMPLDIVEAGRIDGASELKIYHSIVIPIMKPAMATMAIFSVVGSWNNFLTPLTLLTDEKKYTLPLMVQMLKGDIYMTQFGAIYLGIALTILPLVVIYFMLSKYIIRGVAMGSVKG